MPAAVGRAQDKKFFVRVIECWFNACESDMSKKVNATETLWTWFQLQFCIVYVYEKQCLPVSKNKNFH